MAPFHSHSRGRRDSFTSFIDVIGARAQSTAIICKPRDFGNKHTLNSSVIDTVPIISDALLMESTLINIFLMKIKLQNGC